MTGRISDLVYGTVDAAFAIDGGQRLVAVNEACGRLLGIEPGAAIGRPCNEMLARQGEGGCGDCGERCPLVGRFGAGETVELDWKSWRRPDGVIVPISATPLTIPPALRDDGTLAIVIVRLADAAQAMTAPRPELLVRLLGSPEVTVDGVPAVLPRRRKAIELLALLALSRSHLLARDEVLETLWPCEAYEQSAPRLRVTLHELRQLLGTAVRRSGETIFLACDAALHLDTTLFEDAVERAITTPMGNPAGVTAVDRALALYRGDLLEGEEFGLWLDTERERLRRRYHELLMHGANRFACHGEIERSIDCCLRALRSDPLLEAFHRALIVYYGITGRRIAALRQFEDCRRLLADELGIGPSPRTEQAFERAMAL